MKIGLAVAAAGALPSAFVVLRDDLCRCVDRCAALGYDGVELALRNTAEVNLPELKRRLAATGLEVPCISSGQVFADIGYDGYLTAEILPRPDPDSAARQAIQFLRAGLAARSAATA